MTVSTCSVFDIARVYEKSRQSTARNTAFFNEKKIMLRYGDNIPLLFSLKNKTIMIIIALLPIITAALIWFEAPWWLQGALGLPTFLVASGWGIAKRFHHKPDRNLLATAIDASWISLGLLWINISIIRELAILEALYSLVFLTAIETYIGIAIAWKQRFHVPLPKREKIGVFAIMMAIVILCGWKNADISRTLDGYWYLEGADDPRNERVALRPGRNWNHTENVGDVEAGAMRLYPKGKNPDLIATTKVNGRVTLAVRGPIGSYIEAGGEKAEVKQYVVEQKSEGPVRRYLNSGIASISVWVDLQPGEYFGLDVQGDEVYLIPSSNAVWSLHAIGALRFTHYYQILNQVENQVWAQEVLNDRRFTWNQPPGWSPILAASTLLVMDDLPGASMLFLWVLMLVGLSSVRLCSIVAPYAPSHAYVIPAALVLVHGQLMLLPASQNFPDSLYTAAILGVFIGLFEANHKHAAWLGFASQCLRWPGAILATYFWFIHATISKKRTTKFLVWLWSFIAAGGVVALIATQTGDADQLFEILYFETFPEHWHGNYNPLDLLARVPLFYTKWFMYTGGTLLLVLPFLLGPERAERRSLRIIAFSIAPYSLLLSTIDHHPSHYFLPLVACTGPMFVLTTSLVGKRASLLIALALGGIGFFLWNDFV